MRGVKRRMRKMRTKRQRKERTRAKIALQYMFPSYIHEARYILNNWMYMREAKTCMSPG